MLSGKPTAQAIAEAHSEKTSTRASAKCKTSSLQRMLQLPDSPCMRTLASVEDAYQLCRQITAKYASYSLSRHATGEAKPSVELFGQFMLESRRTDELVDGPSAALTTPETLDRWEAQLESMFAGQPLEDPDVALVDTLQRFPVGHSAVSRYDCRSAHGLVPESLP